MQTTKSRNGCSDILQRTSPAATPRTARRTKSGGSDSSPLPSPNNSRNLKNSSPRTLERSSPKSPLTEKKRMSKISELECQLAQYKEELKRAKESVSSFEAQKKQAQQEAEETKKQLSFLSAKLEDSRQQLVELSESEESRLQELRKISQERDQVWQSELESLQKQHAKDSSSLVSSMNEIQRLKKQLEIVAEAEATQSRHAESAHKEIQTLRVELSETLELVDEIKSQLADTKESEYRALEIANEARLELEETKANAEAIRSDSMIAMEAYSSLVSELEQSNAQAITLENLVSKLQSDLDESNATSFTDCSGGAEIDSLKLEIGQLRSALEASEIRYQEEYIQSTLQIRSAYEAVENAKSESSLKEAELEQELRKAKDAITQLQSDLSSKHNTLQYISLEKEELTIKILENQTCIKDSELRVELKKLEVDLTHLKSALLDKETEIQSVSEENDMLRTEMSERSRVNEEAVALAQAAKEAEREALMKLNYATEEADGCNRRAEKVVEQLQAAQTENGEMEAQLRRLKVQTDQWRKAAEAAASMLSPGRDSKMVDRTVSLDSRFHTIGMKMDSPFSDIMDYDSPKKRSGNMLRKIGGFWKKSPRKEMA